MNLIITGHALFGFKYMLALNEFKVLKMTIASFTDTIKLRHLIPQSIMISKSTGSIFAQIERSQNTK